MPDVIVLDESETQSLLKSGKGKREETGKYLLIGGGLLALILFLLMRKKGGGQPPGDKSPLLFKLKSDGLWLGNQGIDIDSAIARVLAGKRNDALVQPAGDVRQGDVEFVTKQFARAGINLRLQPLSSSVYVRGLGA